MRIFVRLYDRLVGRLDLLAGEIETPDGPAACFWGSALACRPTTVAGSWEPRCFGPPSGLARATAACAASRMSRPLYCVSGTSTSRYGGTCC